jgi:hypothetical protein
VFSVRSVPEDQLLQSREPAGRHLVEGCCSRGRGQFGNPEEGERPLLEASTKQRLVKTVTENTNLCVIVICKE